MEEIRVMINILKAGVRRLSALKVLYNCKHIKHNHEPVKVVFILQYLPAWEKVKILYDKMLQQDKIVPYIVCIPMEQKHKDIRYSVFERNDTYDFFINQGYQAINGLCEDGGWFDLKSLEPDYVFYTRPYNMFLPDGYKCSSVARYAKICVVMYAISISSIDYGIIHRDFFNYVSCHFAENEEMKNFFAKKFFLGRLLRLQKSVAVGAPVLETVYDKRYDKTDIWNFGESGLKVLWLPRWSTDKKIGGSNFFKYKDELLNYYSDGSDKLLIRPHPLMFQNFINTGEWTEKQKEDFIEKCELAKGISIDESQFYAATLWSSDILITDVTSVIIEYFITGKPIIFCDSDADVIYTKLMKEILSCCYVVQNKEELFKTINALKNKQDPLKDKRESFAREVLNRYANKCSEQIINMILEREI